MGLGKPARHHKNNAILTHNLAGIIDSDGHRTTYSFRGTKVLSWYVDGTEGTVVKKETVTVIATDDLTPVVDSAGDCSRHIDGDESERNNLGSHDWQCKQA